MGTETKDSFSCRCWELLQVMPLTIQQSQYFQWSRLPIVPGHTDTLNQLALVLEVLYLDVVDQPGKERNER